MFVDKEYLEERIAEIILDHKVATESGIEIINTSTLPRLIADEVYNILRELDEEDYPVYEPEDDDTEF